MGLGCGWPLYTACNHQAWAGLWLWWLTLRWSSAGPCCHAQALLASLGKDAAGKLDASMLEAATGMQMVRRRSRVNSG